MPNETNNVVLSIIMSEIEAKEARATEAFREKVRQQLHECKKLADGIKAQRELLADLTKKRNQDAAERASNEFHGSTLDMDADIEEGNRSIGRLETVIAALENDLVREQKKLHAMSFTLPPRTIYGIVS